jgi:hypothetical protein
MTSRYSKIAAAMSPRITLGILLLCSMPLFAQEFRLDIPLQTSGPNVPVSGGPLPQTLWVANATVYICAHPSTTLAACQGSLIQTYTDSTGNTTCPTSTQLVQLPGNTCSSTAGAAANLGIWYAGGQVDYWIVSSYGTFGPFTANTAAGGGAGNPSPPAFCVQLANITSSAFTCDSEILGNTNTHTLSAPTVVEGGPTVDPRFFGAVADSGVTDNGPAIQNAINVCPLTTANIISDLPAARAYVGCKFLYPSTGGGFYDVRTVVYLAQKWNLNLSSNGAGTITATPTSCISGCVGSPATIAGIQPNVLFTVASQTGGVANGFISDNALVTSGGPASFTYSQTTAAGTATGVGTFTHSVWFQGDGNYGTYIKNDTGQNWWLVADAGQYNFAMDHMTVNGGTMLVHTALQLADATHVFIPGPGLKGQFIIGPGNQLLNANNWQFYAPAENGLTASGWFNTYFYKTQFSKNCGSIGLFQGNSAQTTYRENMFWEDQCANSLAGATVITSLAVTSGGLLNTLTVTQANTFAPQTTITSATLGVGIITFATTSNTLIAGEQGNFEFMNGAAAPLNNLGTFTVLPSGLSSSQFEVAYPASQAVGSPVTQTGGANFGATATIANQPWAGPFALTAAANASGGNTVYTGTITGCTTNTYNGINFTVVGADQTANNGTFQAVACTSTTLTLNNASGVSDTFIGKAINPTLNGNYLVQTATSSQWTANVNSPIQTVSSPGAAVAVLSSVLNPDVIDNSPEVTFDDNDAEVHSPEVLSIPYYQFSSIPDQASCGVKFHHNRFGGELSPPGYPPMRYMTFGPLVATPTLNTVNCGSNFITDNRFEANLNGPITALAAIQLNIPLEVSTIGPNFFGGIPDGAFSGAIVEDDWATAQVANPNENVFSYGNYFDIDTNGISNYQGIKFGYNNYSVGPWVAGGGNGWNPIIPQPPGRVTPELLNSTNLSTWDTTPSGTTLTANLTGPDGITDSAYTLATTAGGNLSNAFEGLNVTGPGYFNCSGFFKAGGTQAVNLLVSSNTAQNQFFPLDNSWTQHSVTFWVADSTPHAYTFVIEANQGGPTAPAGSIGVYQPHCVAGNTPLTPNFTSPVIIGQQQNLIPDAGLQQGTSTNGWTVNASMPIQPGGAGGGNQFVYTGTGSASGTIDNKSGVINVTPGENLVLSACMNATNCTSPSPTIGVYNSGLTTRYGVIGQLAGTASCTTGSPNRVSATFAVPSGVTQVYVVPDTTNTTCTSGQPMTFSDIYLGEGTTDPGWRPNTLDNTDLKGVCRADGTNCPSASFTLTTTGTSGPATYTGGVLNIPQYAGGGSMTWPSGGAGIPNYSGSSSWGTSYSASNTIPANFISTLNQNTTGNAATATTATTATNATNATNVATTASTASGTYYFLAVPSTSGNQGAVTVAGMTIDPATGAVAFPSSITAGGAGASIRTGTTSNTDLAGQLTLSGGTASYSFAATYTNPPYCVVTDNSAVNAVEVVVTASALTITGTGTDKVTYICVATD